jgi:hypothetical protein
MKLPVLLKEAILEGDWDKVCFIYKQITGEDILPPQPKVVSEEEMLASMELPSLCKIPNPEEQLLGSNIHIPPTNIDQQPSIQTNTNIIDEDEENNTQQKFTTRSIKGYQHGDDDIAAKKLPLKKGYRPQLFVDNGTLAYGDKISSNPSLAKMYVPPRPRERGNNLVHVQCSVCQKWFDLSPILTNGYSQDPKENTFRCNDCLSSRGRVQQIRDNI